MAAEDLLTERRDGVLYLTLNRPEKLNALSEPMLAGLVVELSEAARDHGVGAVVMRGAGRAFCAGGDITHMNERARQEAARPAIEQQAARLRGLEESSLLLHEMPKVTIAALNGPAVGAGLSLALACDLRIAADTARLGTGFARVGYSGDFGGSWTLTRLVGTGKARELYFLAEMIDAAQALALGIVNRVVPATSLEAEVEALACRIAGGPRVAYAYMKANLNAALTSDLRALLEREALGQTLTGLSEDHREAVRAFLEKRAPRFTGR
ncbi:MAG: enoyl-CoA hydratase [Deltaproteobacteria bacterium]|jgi:2-(1,2-epoxy-1,2-dihydrophenyl)acetyl-CoA isomerase|nr:enoyl-CoA hydratase [Deltaproteobacteria bacterium]